jgi:excisionase family DNA binding protein
MAQGNRNTLQSSNTSRTVKRAGGGAAAASLGSFFLGVCVLIAGLNIGSGVKKLNDTISEKLFASTYVAPNELSLSDKKYLTEAEAADYLNITSQRVVELIARGEITRYIRTEDGYSISVDALDEWFEAAVDRTGLSVGLPTEE